jgi:pimeloyl-ACP methyl ester carboxylesterase
MFPPTIYIFVNGILTIPAHADNWTGRAVTWVQLNTSHKAEKVEYFTGIVSRWIGDGARARKLAKTIKFYLAKQWRIVLVGHSNGCDVILDALQLLAWPHIHGVHLISAACEADFGKNGLNAAGSRVGHLSIYIAERDWALMLADTLPARLLGYGVLGKDGPKNSTWKAEPDRVVRRDFGHGGWFTEKQFDATMRLVTEA